MENKQIPAILVNGFMDAGKTTYIIDCLKNDYFCKRHDTLLLVLEDGEAEYDPDFLAEKRTALEIYPGSGDLSLFILSEIKKHSPDRIYLEMNSMIPEIYLKLPEILKITFSITIVDGKTLPIYYRNMRQQLQDMIKASHQVILRCAEKEMLSPFGNAFRIMNNKAIYLWEAPQGYHEKAFGVMVPYDLNQEKISLSDSDYTPFYLDALEAPEHYEGKQLTFYGQVRNPDPSSGQFQIGRTVMTCCMADIQFLSFSCQLEYPAEEKNIAVSSFEKGTDQILWTNPECDEKHFILKNYSWIHLTAIGHVTANRFRQKKLSLQPIEITGVGAEIPEELIRLI